jgi:L,D-transpeptidase catalytic domain
MQFCRRLATALVFAIALVLTHNSVFAKTVEIVVSKTSQKMTVKVDGETEYVWPVSTGAGKYETPTGSFRPFRMEAEHFSKEWDDAPMPNSIFFTGDGHAIHGSFHVKSLGRKASHGCVRLAPENAAKLFALVSEAGMGNTRVVLKGGLFDFSSNTRSLSEVGSGIDKTVKAKPSRGFFWNWGQADKKPVLKVAKKKDAKPKAVKAVTTKKPTANPKKLVGKCVVRDGRKLCTKAPLVKAASNG